MACVRVIIDQWPLSKYHVDNISHHYNIFHICCLYNSVEVFVYLLGLIEHKDELEIDKEEEKEKDKEKEDVEEEMKEKPTETYYECSDFESNENEEKIDEESLNKTQIVNTTLGK